MRLGTEERLLCLMCLARLDGPARREARALARAIDWPKLTELAELNRVTPMALKRCRELGLKPPRATLRTWQASARPANERNRKRVVWARKLLTACDRAGVRVIVLKGSLFADTLYGDTAYKRMNDLDVLVRSEDAPKAIGILRQVGFDSVGELFGKKEISASSHHTPPFVSRDLGCVVGLHWSLTSPLAPWKPSNEGIWKRARKVEVAGAPAYGMSWEDNLLHLCIHLPFFKIGLRELADVYNVARFGKPDWSLFDRLLAEARAEDAVYRVLGLADALAGLGIPAARKRRLFARWRARSGAMTLADTDARLSAPNVILRSRSTQVSKIEKAYAIFRLSANYGERVKAWAGMWAFMLWPKRAEVDRLVPPSRARWRVPARLQAPARIWMAMARDHGQLPLAAITAVNAGLVARDTVLRPFRKDGPSLRKHKAARLLEVLE